MARAPCRAGGIAAYAAPRLELNSTRLMRSRALCIEDRSGSGKNRATSAKIRPDGAHRAVLDAKNRDGAVARRHDRRRVEILTSGQRVQVLEISRIIRMLWRCGRANSTAHNG